MPSNTHGDFTFDGPNKIITLGSGVVQMASSAIYSRWKDWLQESPDRLKYDAAFAGSVGGDSLGGGVLVGAYYFLQNGWVIRPQESDHTLVVSGNVFPIPDTAAMFTSTIGDFQVVIGMRTSSLTQTILQSAASSTSAIADAVWDKDISAATTGAGKDLSDTKKTAQATLGVSA